MHIILRYLTLINDMEFLCILMKCQAIFSGKNKKIILKCCLQIIQVTELGINLGSAEPGYALHLQTV